MVGKLNLDLGEDYAFDIRRAREVAEGAGPGQIGGGGGTDAIKPGETDGPFNSPHGQTYWLRVTAGGQWKVGWNLDSEPEPDLWRKLTVFLNDAAIEADYRGDVRSQAMASGWDGVS